MKKILTMAILVVAGACLTTAQAGKKDKNKKQKQEPVQAVQPVVLASTADSLSYAAGYAATQGIRQYLVQQGVDTAYIADFLRGYEDAVQKSNTPAFRAYEMGLSIAGSVSGRVFPNMSSPFAGTADSLRSNLFHEGFMAGVKEDTTIYSAARASELFEGRAKAASDAKNMAYKAENEAWLKTNATKEGVVTLPSGLQYKVLKAGTGAKPAANQTVEVIYEGRTIDGQVFDATSRHQGVKTDKFACNEVIKGWTEALTNMPVGSKWELYIPQELAYGGRASGRIRPYSTLIFTVELVGIESNAADKAAAEKVSAAPAKKTVKAPAKKSTARKRARR